MTTSDAFRKMIIKEIMKTDRYKLRKKEIGKIRSLSFVYVNTKVLRSNPMEYCEETDFIVNINMGAASLYLRLYTDGSIVFYD